MKTRTLFLVVVFLTLCGLYGCEEEKKYTDVSGVWSTDFNLMTLTQNATDEVNGTYEFKGGVLQGQLTGTTLSGTWTQTNAHGTFIFEFNHQFTEFNGVWGYNDATPTQTWNGKRVE